METPMVGDTVHVSEGRGPECMVAFVMGIVGGGMLELAVLDRAESPGLVRYWYGVAYRKPYYIGKRSWHHKTECLPPQTAPVGVGNKADDARARIDRRQVEALRERIRSVRAAFEPFMEILRACDLEEWTHKPQAGTWVGFADLRALRDEIEKAVHDGG